MNEKIYSTKGEIQIARTRVDTQYEKAVESYVDRLDHNRGAVFSSNYEYPGRYTRWDTAIINPPLGIEAKGKTLELKAYNDRGKQILDIIAPRIEAHIHVKETVKNDGNATFTIIEDDEFYTEEFRSRRPNIFSVVREIVDMLYSEEDDNLALYGAFGYDLVFQFEEIEKHIEREKSQRDMVLFLPDEILVVDHHSAQAWHLVYEFSKRRQFYYRRLNDKM